jgi:hypothetical protein
MKTIHFVGLLFVSLFILVSCNKEDVNRKRFAGEYTVEKIEYYTADASNNPTLIKTKNDVGTITLLEQQTYGAEYDFTYVLDTIPAGFAKAWVVDDFVGPAISHQWSIDIGNKNLLILQGRNWTQSVEAYAYYTVEQGKGKHCTWTFYTINSATAGNYTSKEVLYLKKK